MEGHHRTIKWASAKQKAWSRPNTVLHLRGCQLARAKDLEQNAKVRTVAAQRLSRVTRGLTPTI